jgi:hypothetical protein
VNIQNHELVPILFYLNTKSCEMGVEIEIKFKSKPVPVLKHTGDWGVAVWLHRHALNLIPRYP